MGKRQKLIRTLSRPSSTAVGLLGGLDQRPSFEAKAPLELVELPPRDQDQRRFINEHNSYFRRYRLGQCSVIVTKELGKWHLSISHRARYPTWDEVAEARYRLLPESIVAAMILPPRSAYINLDSHCFQVFEIDDQGFA